MVVSGMKKTAKKAHPLLTCVALILLLALCVSLYRPAVKRFYEAVYPLGYTETVEKEAEAYNISPSLIYAVIHTESHFKPDAVSSAEAKGLMQLTDDTYRWALQRTNRADSYDPQQLFDPVANIHWGVVVLSLLSEQFTNTETLLAAYNAGQGHVREWLEDPAYSADGVTLHTIPYPETEQYVKRVLDARRQYKSLYNLD